MSLLDLSNNQNLDVEMEIPTIGSHTLSISRTSSLTKHQGEGAFTHNGCVYALAHLLSQVHNKMFSHQMWLQLKKGLDLNCCQCLDQMGLHLVQPHINQFKFAYKLIQGLYMKFVHKHLNVDEPSQMNSNRKFIKIKGESVRTCFPLS